MKSIFLLSLFLISPQISKNDPDGIWESENGSRYELHLTGSNLKVTMVPGSSPRFLKYDVDLKNTEEVNTYAGSGYFVAKLSNNKECRFETEWLIVVVTKTQIIGSTSSIIPDPETCEVKEKGQAQIQLKKQE